MILLVMHKGDVFLKYMHHRDVYLFLRNKYEQIYSERVEYMLYAQGR
jgi:hypothetical protein